MLCTSHNAITKGFLVPNAEIRRKELELRLTPADKHALQAAPRTAYLSVKELVLESAVAEETLPDRQRFGLSAERWAAFQAGFSAPRIPTRRLAKLLNEPGVFDNSGV